MTVPTSRRLLALVAATAPGDSTPTDPGNVMAPITVAAAFVVLVAVLLARRSRAA